MIRNGQTGYLMKDNGKEYFYSREELDLTKISFAEQELMSAADGKYIYDIVAPKENELTPKLYVTASQLKTHAGNATYDTGESFIIPHIDHIHVVPYSWLTAEEIASVKYIMQHPEDRPEIWTEGHGSKKEIGTIVNVTPESERSKLKNWQIIHSADEVRQALKEGKFADSDGYIFAPEDVLDPGTFVWKESFSIPRATGGSLRAISKKELSEQEWAAAQELLAKAKADKEKDKDKKEETSKDQKSQSSESKKDDNLTEGQGTVYSASEIAAAKKAGRYVSYEDGYIFNASDIISDEGDQYIVVYKDYVHWVDKTRLSKSEEASAQAFCKKKGLVAPAKDDKSYFTPDKESAEEVYDRVTPQKSFQLKKCHIIQLMLRWSKMEILSFLIRTITITLQFLGLMIQKPSKHQVVIAWKNFLQPSSIILNIQNTVQVHNMVGEVRPSKIHRIKMLRVINSDLMNAKVSQTHKSLIMLMKLPMLRLLVNIQLRMVIFLMLKIL